MKSKLILSGLLIVTLLLVGCGPQPASASGQSQPPAITQAPATIVSSGGSSGYSSGSGTSSTPVPSSPATPAGNSGAATVMVSQNSTLGSFLVDSQGMTLYVFMKDTQNGNSSACAGTCANNWPALTVSGSPVAGQGVDSSLLGSFQLPDGTSQVTYNGWPLYTFAKDANPGDTNGQGVLTNWYVISPGGDAVKK